MTEEQHPLVGLAQLRNVRYLLGGAARHVAQRDDGALHGWQAQFDQPIARFGMIQRKLADTATRIYVADSMSYRTAGLMVAAAEAIDQDAPEAARRLVKESIEEYTIEASILKVFGTETPDFVGSATT